METKTKKPVRKAVIAAAGFGTRFLPQTKAMPKEMLPIVDKPVIQYIVEELVEAGIEDIIIVTGYHKRSIEDHFDQMSADLRVNQRRRVFRGRSLECPGIGRGLRQTQRRLVGTAGSQHDLPELCRSRAATRAAKSRGDRARKI